MNSVPPAHHGGVSLVKEGLRSEVFDVPIAKRRHPAPTVALVHFLHTPHDIVNLPCQYEREVLSVDPYVPIIGIAGERHGESLQTGVPPANHIAWDQDLRFSCSRPNPWRDGVFEWHETTSSLAQ